MCSIKLLVDFSGTKLVTLQVVRNIIHTEMCKVGKYSFRELSERKQRRMNERNRQQGSTRQQGRSHAPMLYAIHVHELLCLTDYNKSLPQGKATTSRSRYRSRRRCRHIRTLGMPCKLTSGIGFAQLEVANVVQIQNRHRCLHHIHVMDVTNMQEFDVSKG